MNSPTDPARSVAAGRRRRRLAARGSPNLLGRLFRRPEQIALILLALAVAGSALAVGGVHVVTLVCVGLVTAMSAGLALRELRLHQQGLPLGSVLMLALAGYSLLQSVPLPTSAVRLVSPQGYEVWQGTLALLGKPSAWGSVSLDPRASLVEALKWATYAAVYATAVYLGRRGRMPAVLLMLFGTALALALITLAHRAAGATRLYGVYQPVHANPYFALAPLLNPNNLAGYLNLGAFAGLGLAMSRQVSGPKWLLVLGASVVVAVSGLAASRGGWVALAVAVVALAAGLAYQSRGARGWRTRSLALIPLGALLGGGALFALSVRGGLWVAIAAEGTKKVELISWSLPLIADFPATGVGRGAFETAFPAYRGDLGRHVYSHAENFVAQWAAEWGLVVTALALGAFSWAFRPSVLGAMTSRSALCATIGLGAVLLQNLADLALEIASVGIAFSAALGALVGSARRTGATSAVRASVALPVVLVGLAAAVLVLGRSTALDQRRILGMAVSDSSRVGAGGQEELMDSIRAAMRWRPADPFFPYLGGVVAHRRGENELPWIARAVERDPMEGRTYLLLGHALARRGALQQSRLSLRMAMERDFSMAQPATTLALASNPTLQELIEATPEGARGAPSLLVIARRVSDPAARAGLLEEALSRDPGNAQVASVRVADLVHALESNGPPCDGEHRRDCAKQARALARVLGVSAQSQAAILEARVLLSEGHVDEARRLLTVGCSGAELECVRWRIEVARRSKATDELVAISKAVLGGSCAPPPLCADVCGRLGEALAAHSAWTPAAEAYERAARILDTPAAWDRVSRAAVRAGMNGLAVRAIQRSDAARATPR